MRISDPLNLVSAGSFNLRRGLTRPRVSPTNRPLYRLHEGGVVTGGYQSEEKEASGSACYNNGRIPRRLAGEGDRTPDSWYDAVCSEALLEADSSIYFDVKGLERLGSRVYNLN